MNQLATNSLGVVVVINAPEKPKRQYDCTNVCATGSRDCVCAGEDLNYDDAVTRAISEGAYVEDQGKARYEILLQSQPMNVPQWGKDLKNQIIKPNQTFPTISVPPGERVRQFQFAGKWYDENTSTTDTSKYNHRTVFRFSEVVDKDVQSKGEVNTELCPKCFTGNPLPNYAKKGCRICGGTGIIPKSMSQDEHESKNQALEDAVDILGEKVDKLHGALDEMVHVFDHEQHNNETEFPEFSAIRRAKEALNGITVGEPSVADDKFTKKEFEMAYCMGLLDRPDFDFWGPDFKKQLDRWEEVKKYIFETTRK